jgi:hypothetical protein
MKRLDFNKRLEENFAIAREINENSQFAKKIERELRQLATLANEINSKAREIKK